MKKLIYFLLFINTFAYIAACDKCKDDENLVTGECKENGDCDEYFVCSNGECKCPYPNIYFGGICIPPSNDPNTMTFIGYEPACMCFDSFLFAVIGNGSIRAASFADGPGGSGTTAAQYFDLPGLDSLYVLKIAAKCVIPGLSAGAYGELFGKFRNDTTLEATIVFHDALNWGNRVDTCTMLMTRR